MPNEPRLMDHLYIKIDGRDLPPAVMDDLIEVIVDSNLHLPDMFTIHVHDEALQWLDEGPFALGKVVEIAALPETEGTSRVLIKGEITALEPDFGDGTQATLLVRGYDRSHRLQRGTHSRAYLQVTDSDLVNRIAQEAGLQAQVDATTEVYDHVLQANQTHLEFLTERARRIGYEFFVEDRTLYFRQPSRAESPLELEWGRELKQFRPRLTLAEQVDEVIVKGWDPQHRQEIVGQATAGQAEPEIGVPQGGSQLALTAFDQAQQVIVDEYVNSHADADSLAQAICDELSGAFIEAEGVCYGQPDLRAGKFVRLTALGRRFSGIYFVTAATHIYRAGSEYLTTFSISARRPKTLYHLLRHTSAHSNARLGPVVGLVTNNNDPEGWGRVKVKFPWLSDEVESDWTRLVSLGAGSERGFYCLPEVNDEVLIAFEQGDVNRPYVLGGLWNGQDQPPLPNDQVLENGQVHRRTFQTRVGHSLILTDGSEAGVVLETAGGHKVILDDANSKISVESSAGLKLNLDDSSSKITIESGSEIAITAGSNLTIEASGNMDLKASGQVNIKGAMINLN